MTFIKKMVLHGFKSFAKRTEIPFDRGINVIIGANGSGKSNISDGLCFALGRLSIKSMRAAKAKNLLFMGSKYIKPAHEASVELVFDNAERTFGIDNDEIILKRIVRSNGQGIYKINDETKTRAEIIELLAHAGIDPHGFNIVLQGGIQSIVKMHPEDRRKIIEEVAGISIYESRKEKSLKELDKTEEKLREVNAVLRERRSYMNNLDKERAQAMRFKELEQTEKRCKASVLHKKLSEKKDELDKLMKSLEREMGQKDEIKSLSETIQKEIETLSVKIGLINKHIHEATGLEQDKLNESITNLKAELEGLRVKRENSENRKEEVERRIAEISKNIPEIENEIKELKKKSPLMAKKAQELKRKRDELAQLSEERNKLLTLKSEINSIKERIKDKTNHLSRLSLQSESVLRQLETYSDNLQYKGEEECQKEVGIMKEILKSGRESISLLNKKELDSEKMISALEHEIKNAMKVKADVQKIDVCPLCQSKMTVEHVGHVTKNSDEKINKAKEELDKINAELERAKSERDGLIIKLRDCEAKISTGEIELTRHRTIKNFNSQIKKFVDEDKIIDDEIKVLEEKRANLESKGSDLSAVEEKYHAKLLEIEEISSRTEENTDQTILYKERDLESMHNVVKRNKQDLLDIDISIREISSLIGSKENALEEKEEQAERLNDKFNKMIHETESMQAEIGEKNINLTEVQSNLRDADEQINSLKIVKAKLDAEKETLEISLQEFAGIEIIPGSINAIEEKLTKVQESLRLIGSINMRALEVFEEVKKEYDLVALKVETLNKEKDEIMKIVAEIDMKKRREFMRTFREINERFTQNFSKLYTKGIAYLEIENKEDIFSGGVGIAVKLAKGKFFDVTSLSGGEQTLVALSLLFAIQEYKPYHFYIFDEIDAALDKRNSERLAALLKQYMTGGQYIVVTHNDAIITDSTTLYGVSMHEGVSKILSLKLEGELAKKPEQVENIPEGNNS